MKRILILFVVVMAVFLAQCGSFHPAAQSTGPQGPAGPAGPAGPQGPQGPQGPAGTLTAIASFDNAVASLIAVNGCTTGDALGPAGPVAYPTLYTCFTGLNQTPPDSVGPAITVNLPAAGVGLVTLSANVTHSGGAVCNMSFQGANISSIPTNSPYSVTLGGAQPSLGSVSGSFFVQMPAGTTTLTVIYSIEETTASSPQPACNWSNRYISFQPVQLTQQ